MVGPFLVVLAMRMHYNVSNGWSQTRRMILDEVGAERPEGVLRPAHLVRMSGEKVTT